MDNEDIISQALKDKEHYLVFALRAHNDLITALEGTGIRVMLLEPYEEDKFV